MAVTFVSAQVIATQCTVG